VIHVTGINCAPLSHQRDEMTWHDSYEATHPSMEKFERIEPLHRTGNTVRATFIIRRSDTRGVGILDLFCGGGHGNAVTSIRVE
jgi:2-polyprenyl-3-methyl-5-hydroxy-6-metoxy-1,4-benzoquinol methylase